MMARTMVVLPVPGPPVMTSSFCVTASRIASRWLAAKAIAHLLLGPRDGRVDVDRRQRVRPAGQRLDGRATPSSARNSGLRKMQGIGSRVGVGRRIACCASLCGPQFRPASRPPLAGSIESRTTSSVIRSCSMASAMPVRRDLRQSRRRVSRSSSSGKPTWPSPLRFLKHVPHRRLRPERRVARHARASSASSSAVWKPTPQMSVLRRYGFALHHLDGVLAVGLVDADGPGGADAVAVQEDHDRPHGLLLAASSRGSSR